MCYAGQVITIKGDGFFEPGSAEVAGAVLTGLLMLFALGLAAGLACAAMLLMDARSYRAEMQHSGGPRGAMTNTVPRGSGIRRDEPGFVTIGVGTLRADVHFFKFFSINFTSAIVKPRSYIHASSTPRPRSAFNATENSS